MPYPTLRQKRETARLIAKTAQPVLFDEASRLIRDLRREAESFPALLERIVEADHTGDTERLGRLLSKAKRRMTHGVVAAAAGDWYQPSPLTAADGENAGDQNMSDGKVSCGTCRHWRENAAKADEHEVIFGAHDDASDSGLGRCLGQQVNVLVPRDDGGNDDLQSRRPLAHETYWCENYDRRS